MNLANYKTIHVSAYLFALVMRLRSRFMTIVNETRDDNRMNAAAAIIALGV